MSGKTALTLAALASLSFVRDLVSATLIRLHLMQEQKMDMSCSGHLWTTAAAIPLHEQARSLRDVSGRSPQECLWQGKCWWIES